MESHGSITVYTGQNKYYVASTNFWRHITTRLPKRLLYAISHVAVPLYYIYRIPVLRQIGMGIFPINMDPRWRWRVLDTFDCYSPKYQSFHSYPEVFGWFEAVGCERIRAIEPAVTVMKPPTVSVNGSVFVESVALTGPTIVSVKVPSAGAWLSRT